MAYGEFEIRGFTNKPEDSRIFLNGNNNDKESFMAKAQTPNEDFDLSPVYVNVDGNCPWTNLYITNNQNTSEENPPELVETKNEVSLFPILPNQLYSNSQMYTGTGIYNLKKDLKYGSIYYQQQSWFNSEQALGIDTTFAGYQGNDFPVMRGNLGESNPVTKFGSRSVILYIRVIAGKIVNGQLSNIQASSLKNYCETEYKERPYVSCVQVVPYILNTDSPAEGLHRYNSVLSGSVYSSSNYGPRLSFIPLMPNHNFDVITDGDPKTLELSLFDAYVPSGVDTINDTNQVIFGSIYSSGSSSTVYSKFTQYVITLDDRCDFNYHTNTVTGVKYTEPATDVVKKFGNIDNFREQMRRSTAYFGLYFCEDRSLITETITDYDTFFSDNRMFLGTIDKYGVTHGDYTKGSKNKESEFFKGKNNLQKDTNVRPNFYIPTTFDEDGGDLDSGLNDRLKTSIGYSGKLFKLTREQALKLIRFAGGTFNTNVILNTYDGLINMQYFPINIKSTAAAEDLTLGAYPDKNNPSTIYGFNPKIKAPTLLESVQYFDLGSFSINPVYGDFRDYPPYTSYTLFVPFVNASCDIDPKVWLGHTLRVSLIVDILTGSTSAVLLRDDLIYKTLSGSTGVKINMTSVDMATYNGAVKQAETALKNTEISTITGTIGSITGALASGAEGDVGGVISNLVNGMGSSLTGLNNLSYIDYKLQTTQPKIQQLSTASSAIGSAMPYKMQLVRISSKMLPEYDSDTYAKTVGYACIKNTTLSQCSNFTVVSNINLDSLSCDNEEKRLIHDVLMSGILIK